MSDNGKTEKTEKTEKPLVSCLMVTWNRPLFIPMSVKCFLDQTYENVELVIVDDGEPIRQFLPPEAIASGRIHYIHCTKRLKVGEKDNIACHAAQGELITFWPDDDWCSPRRIERQVEALGDAEVVAIEKVPYVHFLTGERWMFDFPGHALDGTYLFRRKYFERAPFPRTHAAEAAAFFGGNGKPDPVLMPDTDLYLGTRHNSNAWTGHFASDLWRLDTDPMPLPQPIVDLMARPELSKPITRHEVVFKVASWTGEDAHLAQAPIRVQALEAARRIFIQDAFKNYDYTHPFVVVVDGQAFQATKDGSVVPYQLAFRSDDVDAA